jgi:hypothetical protein
MTAQDIAIGLPFMALYVGLFVGLVWHNWRHDKKRAAEEEARRRQENSANRHSYTGSGYH